VLSLVIPWPYPDERYRSSVPYSALIHLNYIDTCYKVYTEYLVTHGYTPFITHSIFSIKRLCEEEDSILYGQACNWGPTLKRARCSFPVGWIEGVLKNPTNKLLWPQHLQRQWQAVYHSNTVPSYIIKMKCSVNHPQWIFLLILLTKCCKDQ